MTNILRTCSLALLVLASASPVRSQEKGMSYFLSAGKGLSVGEWGLRYVVSAGVESPLGSGFSISSSLNYLEFPYYDYPGLSRVVSHGSKSDVSIAALVKLSAPWSVSPFIATGLGLAVIRQGEVVKQPMAGGTWVTPAQTRMAFFVGLKGGIEITVLDDLIVSANLAVGVGSYLYSDNFSGLIGVRFWI